MTTQQHAGPDERAELPPQWLPIGLVHLDAIDQERLRKYAEEYARAALLAEDKGEAVAMVDSALPGGIGWGTPNGSIDPLPDGTLLFTRPQPAQVPQVTDENIDATIAFDDKTSYLQHPQVPYQGTANGDSPEAWRRRYIRAMLEAAFSASPAAPEAAPQQQAQEALK